jgi:peptidyl-prolyl cis-trans isomerase SurA
MGNRYLILKINDVREISIPINKEDELNKMIKFETNKQLNQFSKIFFDKSKINYSINEK